ncbi:MAG: hypothetical protein DA408_02975 [Bacteroidetes bacterium]|nr:MAG: hypothetical protein C7N36_06665 [Bacteroidota bacterium]PTM14562.1 MAG: hypothetical protein DA408_02975 [Bacteroidota bacterium]
MRLIYFFFVVTLFSWTPPLVAGRPIAAKDMTVVDLLNDAAWSQKNFSPDSALVLATAALTDACKLNYARGEADALHTIGMIHWLRSDLPKALNYYLKALHIRKKIGDNLGLGRSYNNIGNIYFDQAKYDTALVFYQQGLVIRKALRIRRD